MKRILSVTGLVLATYAFLIFQVLVIFRSSFWLKSVEVTECDGTMYVIYTTIWMEYNSSLLPLEAVSQLPIYPSDKNQRLFDFFPCDEGRPITADYLEESLGIYPGESETFWSAYGQVTIKNDDGVVKISGYYDEPNSSRAHFSYLTNP